ncbi:hypothetical protein [Actinoplanes sp. NPDC051859]|uniref:sulfotransferase-like domain-containing protein n=1 Tax=Actinoplanes sp. NPDC051859 TaxID=3363909 RepID=UPI0037984D63
MVRSPAPGVIALWSAPRSRSTAFLRYMVEHGGVVALHEPFCNLADFGETTVDGRAIHSPAELIAAIRELARTRTVFLKDTTDQRCPAVLGDATFLREVRHTFLIRRPTEVASSFFALKPDMRLADIGIAHQHELLETIRAAGGDAAAIVDAADLMADPAAVLAGYCAAVGLPFRPEALSWPAGARTEWERSGRWHAEVSASTGFAAAASRYADTTENNPRLAAFSAFHEPYYQDLHAQRLIAV